jgi:hypothetical protein
MIALLLLLQGRPPTVGDTVWLSRVVSVPPGATVRAPAWAPDSGDVESLGAAVIVRTGTMAEVRYPAVIWSPGSHTVTLPGPVLLAPGGGVDSLPAAPVTVVIASILPGSVPDSSFAVQPPASAVPARETSGRPLLLWLTGAVPVVMLILLVGRPRPRPAPEAPAPVEAEPPIARWAAAGETRAACEVAARRLREAIHAACPPAHAALETEQVLRVVDGARPHWPHGELRRVLLALDRVRFGSAAGGGEVGPLLDDARRLADELGTGAT